MNPLDLVAKLIPMAVGLVNFIRKLISDANLSEEERKKALDELETALFADVQKVVTQNQLTQAKAGQLPDPAPTAR